MTDSPEPARPGNIQDVPDESSIIIQAQADDLERELRAVQKKKRWHFTWALTGVSPAALLPLIGALRAESYVFVILLFVLVPISQFYLGVKAGTKATRLKEELRTLRSLEHD